MLRKFWQWLVDVLQNWFTGTDNPRGTRRISAAPQPEAAAPPPLTDTDYEFLFTQLLEGVAHGWQQPRVERFFDALGERGNPELWVAWLHRFGERLLASSAPNRELAFRMLQLSEVGGAEITEVAGDIGRQMLSREQERPIWEWSGPDAQPTGAEETVIEEQPSSEEDLQPVTLDELLVMLQQDPGLVQQLAEQLQIETDDPQVIIQAVINQFNAATEPTPEEAEGWFNQGNQQYTAGDFEGAIVSWGRVTELVPDDYQAWNNRGSALANLGRWEEAVASYDKALELQPSLHEAWANRGLALKDLGQLEAALASYDKALQLKLDFHEAWYNRGKILQMLGRYEQAIASYDNSLEIKIDDWESWINRGKAAGSSPGCDPELVSFSAIAQSNPNLNQRGYEGQIASYQEGLQHIPPEMHPEGWGQLHQAIGNAHYERGRTQSNPIPYWQRAVVEYEEALKTLTEAAFPELHLEIVQDLIKAYLDLGQTAEAERSCQRGVNFLQRLFNEPNRPDEHKKQLSLQFIGLYQLSVEIAVQLGQPSRALELAEKSKSAGQSWLLGIGNEPQIVSGWSELQQMLSPNTTAVYWHISPVGLATFILKHNVPQPILLTTSEGEPLDSRRQLQALEAWIKEWNQQYEEFRRPKDKEMVGQGKRTWREQLPEMITQLGNILNISGVIEEITNTLDRQAGNIHQLILIPHRDLHRFPLHALFPDDLIITYLPSAQQGLTLQEGEMGRWSDRGSSPRLLSVEYPNSEGLPSLIAAEIEAAAVTQLFEDPTRLVGATATKEQVTDALSAEYDIFYFNGYGINNLTQLSQSALSLSGKDQLTLEDICHLPLSNYQLVTLSACETAITPSQSISSEYVSLVSCFLSQGVSYILSPLWTVESMSGAWVMIRFYQLFKTGLAPAVALKQAQQWLRTVTNAELTQWYQDLADQLAHYNSAVSEHLKFAAALLVKDTDTMNLSQCPYAHPYHWAAFTLTGKPEY